MKSINQYLFRFFHQLKPSALLIAFILLSSALVFPSVQSIDENDPPNPPLIEGPSSGVINTHYYFNITLTDPNEDDLMYNLEINWGDGTDSIDCGCGKSWVNGTTIEVSHVWTKKGSYNISARVQDNFGTWSSWSDPLPINMPKQSNFIQRILFLINQYISFKKVF